MVQNNVGRIFFKDVGLYLQHTGERESKDCLIADRLLNKNANFYVPLPFNI